MDNTIDLIVKLILYDSFERLVTILNAIASIVMAITSIINLVIIVKFYKEDKKEKSEKEKKLCKESSDKEALVRKSFWYRDIILSRNFNRISDFFDKCNQFASICREQVSETKPTRENKEICRTILGDYTDTRISLRNHFINELRAVDSVFGQAIDDMFDEFQDEFSKSFLELAIDDSNESIIKIERLISNQKTELLSLLYNYEMNNYECIQNTVM